MGRLVGFETHRLDLGMTSHGPEWMDIRDRLSEPERAQMLAEMVKPLSVDAVDTPPTLNLARAHIAMLRAYVAGWQVFADDGQPIPFTRELLERLDSETFSAVVVHIQEWSRAQEAGKAPRATPSVSTHG